MAKELYEEVITARIAADDVDVGWGNGITRIPHRLLGVPNEVEIVAHNALGGSSIDNVGFTVGGVTATYIEVENTDGTHAAPTIRLHAKRFKSDQADIGMSEGYDYHDPLNLVTTPTTSDGIANYSLGKIYDARSGT